MALSFLLSEVPNDKIVTDYICQLENRPESEWNGSTKLTKQYKDSDFPWTEFTLEELGLPDAQYLHDGINNLQYQVGIEGWHTLGNVSERYKGMSLTYNPRMGGNQFYQTLGSNQLTQQVSAGINHGKHTQVKNTYYDSYGFNRIKSLVYRNLKDMWDRFTMMPVRSRVAYANYYIDDDYQTDDQRGWHTDEPPQDVLRLNIPLHTYPEYGIEFKDGTFKHLEVGKAYLWDTTVVHRVGVTEKPKKDGWRINLVIGLAPGWRCKKEGDDLRYFTTDYHGVPINEIVQRKLFVKG